MRAGLRWIALALALTLAQQLAVAVLPELFRPDLVLVLALVMGLRARALEGLLFAFGIGYALDAFSGAPLGLHALLFGTACAVTRALDRALYLRAPLPWGVYSAGYAALNALLMGAVLDNFGVQPPVPWGAILMRLPGTALCTGLLAVPLYSLFRLVEADAERDSGWASLDPRGLRP
jgi:rod shape-determining protein MreD